MPHGESDASHLVVVEVHDADDSTRAHPPLARFTTNPHTPTPLRIVGGPDATARGRSTYSASWHVPAPAYGHDRRFLVRIIVDDSEAVRCDVHTGAPNTRAARMHACGVTIPPTHTLLIQFWIEKPPRLVSVLIGPGVVGSPATDTLVPFGHPLHFTFTPARGFENALVHLDGMPASRSGTVIADTTHVLTATADRHVALSPAVLPLYNAARALLHAANPAAAFQSYLAQAVAYAAAHDSTAIHDLQDVEFLAFDPIRDSAALRRLDDALAARELGTDTIPDTNSAPAPALTPAPVPGADRRSAAARLHTRPLADVVAPLTIADSLEPTVFLYVNGIFTSQFGPGGAVVTNTILRRLIASVPPFDNRDVFDVRHFYNRTRTEQPPTPEQQRAHCVSVFGARLAFGYKGANSFGPFMADCMADPTYRRLSDHDLLECIRQMLALIANTSAAEPDAIRLAAAIQSHRSAGHHLILVPHSQGNLMANQAIHHLRTVSGDYDPARDSTCIGTISLASPTSRRWDLPLHYLVPIVVRGDVVPTIDNAWPAIETDLSRRLLDHPSLETLFAPTGIILHDVIESYFEQPQSRTAIQTGIQSLYGACTVSSVTIHPFAASVTTGSTVTLSATLLNAFDDTLAGHSVRWATSDAAIAAPTTDATTTATTILGATPGTATITARSHAHRAGVPVTVTPRITVDPFTFPYRANYDAGFLGDDPHLSGNFPDPKAVPLPAGYLRLVFETTFGQRVGYVNGVAYNVGEIYPDTVILAGNPYSSYRLAWRPDRLTLSGTFATQIWLYQIGWTQVTLPVTFVRETP